MYIQNADKILCSLMPLDIKQKYWEIKYGFDLYVTRLTLKLNNFTIFDVHPSCCVEDII